MKLTLTTDNGEVIEIWKVQSFGDMTKSMPMNALLCEVQDEIRSAIERGVK